MTTHAIAAQREQDRLKAVREYKLKLLPFSILSPKVTLIDDTEISLYQLKELCEESNATELSLDDAISGDLAESTLIVEQLLAMLDYYIAHHKLED